MPAQNGLARARRRYWVGLRALLWCICIRALARPRHWGRSAVRLGALFASCFPLFPRTARARVKVMRRASPCARLGVVGVGWVGVWGRRDRTAQRTSWCLGSSWVGPSPCLAAPSCRCAPPLTHNPLLPVRSCTAPRPRTCVRSFYFFFSARWGGVQRSGCPCPPARAPVVSRGDRRAQLFFQRTLRMVTRFSSTTSTVGGVKGLV